MENLVQTINGKAVTTSRKVAEFFEKQHKHILEAIRKLEIPEDYRQPNFRPSVYEQPNPSGGKPIQQPEYLITKDGFVLLTMGFTGKKAMQFKIAYIEAFNAMEEQLKQKAACHKVTDITVSTTALIEKINLQLIAGMEVEPEVLRYAWNIGRLIGKSIQKTKDRELEDFIMGLSTGKFSRSEVYDLYCASCDCPVSARRFWPAVRAIRPCEEIRQAYNRYVVFK